MKPIWYIIGVACVLISSIGRMADSLSDVLIALGVIALVVLVIWLFETGKIRLNEQLGRILKKDWCRHFRSCWHSIPCCYGRICDI